MPASSEGNVGFCSRSLLLQDSAAQPRSLSGNIVDISPWSWLRYFPGRYGVAATGLTAGNDGMGMVRWKPATAWPPLLFLGGTTRLFFSGATMTFMGFPRCHSMVMALRQRRRSRATSVGSQVSTRKACGALITLTRGVSGARRTLRDSCKPLTSGAQAHIDLTVKSGPDEQSARMSARLAVAAITVPSLASNRPSRLAAGSSLLRSSAAAQTADAYGIDASIITGHGLLALANRSRTRDADADIHFHGQTGNGEGHLTEAQARASQRSYRGPPASAVGMRAPACQGLLRTSTTSFSSSTFSSSS